MPEPKFEYSFVGHPAINEAFQANLDTPEKKEAFLIRLATTMGANPRTAGELIKGDSFYAGMRKLKYLDEVLGFCGVVFKVEQRTITIYTVAPMKA